MQSGHFGAGWTARLCAVATLAAAPAVAQPAAAPSGNTSPVLTYLAPAGCPDQVAFAEQVRARQRGSGAASPGARPERIEIELSVGEGRALGRIAVIRSGARAERRITAATCAEASEALALIAALAIEGAPEAPEAPPATRGASAPRSPTRASGEGKSEGERGREGESESGRETESGRESEGESDGESEEQGVGGERRESVRVGEAQDEPQEARSSTRLDLLAAGLLAANVQPDPRPALAVSVLLTWLSLPDLSLRAGFRMTSEHRGEYAEGVVAFAWWSGSGALCAGARFAGDSLALRGCLTAEVGRLAARASDTREPEDANRLWAALGPGVLLEWDALPPLVLGAGAEAPFALVRDRFLLADAAVHRAPVLGFRGEILLGVRLW